MPDLIELMADAGDHFAEDDLGPHDTSPNEYIENVVRVTGLPRRTVTKAVGTIHHSFTNIDAAIAAQAPDSDTTVYDTLHYNPTEDITAGYVPKGDNLGLIAPSNHPAVFTLALAVYGMKYPLAIRPSDSDPFTPTRIVHALHEAGLPEESVLLLPGDREIGEKAVEYSDMAIGFGGTELQQKYDSSATVKIHGPGNSKVFVDADRVEADTTVDRLEKAMMADGGRGCINMSQIVTTGSADLLADHLAERIGNVPVRDPLDDAARIPAVPEGEQAEKFDRLISRNLDSSTVEDVTERYDDRPRVIQQNGVTFLRPTVLRLDWGEFEGGEHDLFQEFPFQYATVVSVPASEVDEALSNSLAVTLLSDDRELERTLLRDPSIEKLYANGQLTCDIDLREPHEGYLSDLLFKKQAYRKSES
jgi:acyl-CoA reductase-like NAD-dependent aldehyde dehydrogenase